MENTQAAMETLDISLYVANMSSPLSKENRHSEVVEGSLNWRRGTRIVLRGENTKDAWLF